ncbi:hypothetical protein FYJ27_01965 [Anaerosalibacter bizertensis]|uniref:Uncharacterized protein n=1 Tax=Anaerosalibacter bizertensis TaxID=932217 RepID=A0A844FET0_9FIRM|nr:hypothetical protein [Anaerosalibacter bizertensis]MBU5292867.1 hypothetical protein [Anaerosalibacter bizertensis]MSS42504.1 hypothetical protein [Anaerosalibacter bizertensis]HHV27131.1 hypothetical protein [Tissierellia bacterium]
MFAKFGEDNVNNIELDENIILKNRVPILVRDDEWMELFGETDDKNIKKYKKDLEELLKEQKKIEREISHWNKEKLKCMRMILGISDAINNGEKIESADLLDEYKEKIYWINETIDELTFKLETIPRDIRNLNYELLKATVNYGYIELKDKEEKLSNISSELEDLRERLRSIINEKHDYEEWINDTYTFLHRMLGSKEIERLDREIFE